MGLFANMSPSNRILLGIVGAIVVIVAAIAGFVYWDARTNYVPAKARVVSVVDNCTLVRRRSSSNRTRDEIGPLGCDEARLKQSQGYSRYQLHQHRHLGYTYTSPVDGRTHSGSISATRSDYPDVRIGSEIDILVHETDAAKSRRPI